MSVAGTLRLVARAALAGGGRADFPYKLTFAATGRCNLRCQACRMWQGPGREMPLADVRRFFARSNRFSWIDVTGGEIFLREDIVAVFAAILGNCRSLGLLHYATNGFLTDRIVASTRELMKMRPPRLMVTVSVDGPPGLHDALRGVSGSCERAVETYVRLREIPGCRVVFGMTLSPANRGSYRETLDYLRDAVPGLSPADLHLNLFHRSRHGYDNAVAAPADPAPERALLLEALAEPRRHRPFTLSPLGMVERRYLARAGRYLATGRSPIPCQALAASCFVTAAGVVYPCVTWDHPLGTLAAVDYDLASLWKSPAAREARAIRDSAGCPGCWTPCEAVPALLARWWELPAGC